MPRKPKYYDADVYAMPEDVLTRYYRSIAATADARLRSLEKLAEQDDFKVADKWAYSVAMRDIHKWSGEAAKRFNTKPPANLRDLQKKVTEIEEFLNAPTSSKTGIKEVYQKRSDTYRKDYGIDLHWSEVADFFESTSYKDMIEKGYGSKTVMIAIGYKQKHEKEIKKMLKDAIRNKTHLTGKQLQQYSDDELTRLGFDADEKADIMEFLYSEDPDFGAMVRAMETFGLQLPGLREGKGKPGYTSQDLRNIKNIASDREILWEDLF